MMTSAYTEKQTMKTSKPAMEKRRRARINESLQQLKALVLDGLNKNNSRHSKLEKADILEMTVRYLRNVQRQQVKASMETDPTVLAQYRTGFAECMGEVSRYLGGTTNENPEVKARLLGHLAGLCTTQQRHPHQQPTRYAVVAHGQTPGTNHMQSPPTPAQSLSSAGNFVTLNSAPTTTPASSVHQPMQVSFPTPPLSSGCHVTHPATLMTSPHVGETRTGGDARVFGSQAPAVETQPLSLTSEGANGVPATPKTEARASTARQPAPMTQSLPARTAPSTPQQTGEVITLILPSQSLPGGQVPTHLIPVYAREAGTVLSPPLGFSYATPDPAAASSTPVSSGESCNQPTACDVPTSSPKAATTAPFVIGTGQQTGWTAIPVPAAQLISPQVGAIAPSAVTPPFALSIPLHAKISPPGLAIQTKQAAEQMGRPIQLSGLNAELPGDNDPMWRPW